MYDSYSAYLNYKKVLELLKEKHTVYELGYITKISQTTLYRIINSLLDHNMIIHCGYKLANENCQKPQRIFKVK